MIDRDRYLNQLIERIGTSKIKIVTGLRRSGKSYLLNTIFTNYLLSKWVDKSHIIFIELDDEKNEYLLEKGKLREYIENIASDDNAQYYIILDEIQLVENFVRAVNSLNKHKNYDLYITGSNSKILSKDINDEFKDRGTEINIRPLSFSEFYPAYKGEKKDALNYYLVYGGMPGLFEEPNDLAKKEYDVVLVDTSHILDEINLTVLDYSYMSLFVITNDLVDLKNMRSLLSIFKDTGKKNYLIVLNNSRDTGKDYLSLYDIRTTIKENIDYTISKNYYIKNIDKYVMDGEILTLNKTINAFHQKDVSNMKKIAIDLIDEKHSREEK